MNAITDETLMAYADGTLPRAEMRRVALALQESPALGARLDAFRFTHDELRQPYAPILAMPIPQRLLGAIVGMANAEAKQRWSLGDRLSGVLRRPVEGYVVAAWALAASGVLVAGLSAGWLLHARQFGADDGVPLRVWGVPASKFMQDALDQNARGQAATRAGERPMSVTPVASFRTRDGEWCRSYERTSSPNDKVTGLACRAAEGGWRIKTEDAQLEHAVPAGNNAQSALPPDGLGAIADRYMLGSVLGRAEEAQQIGLRWGAAPSAAGPGAPH
jgi:hypothetical protein